MFFYFIPYILYVKKYIKFINFIYKKPGIWFIYFMLTFYKKDLTFTFNSLYNTLLENTFYILSPYKMKKFLWIMLAWILSIALSVGFVSAASTCLNVKFDNWDSVCLDVTKNTTKSFKISVAKNNLSKDASLRCNILLPNKKIHPLSTCKWSFPYDWTSTESVIIYATYTDRSGDSYFKRQQAKINFKDGSWGSSSDVISTSKASGSSSSSSSSSSNNDEIELSTNRKSPSTSQYVDLSIETSSRYTGKLYLSAKYRKSSSDSRSSISNTSSTYFNDYSSAWSNEYYKMTSSDRWSVTLSNLVKFRKDWYYRIYVRDTDWNESYIQFSVGDTDSSSSNNGELRVSVSPSSPDTYEWVKLTITTDDDYTGKINFTKFQYRSSSSSSWYDIYKASSTYVSDYSSDWSNGYYKMTSSDRGEVILKNLIKFKEKGYYRIYVEDTDGNEAYVQINVDTSSSSSSSNSDLKVSVSPTNPDTYEWVKLTLETDRKYTGKVNFSRFQYRSSSSSSWSTIDRTSSTYVYDYSSDWSNGYYKMTSSDNGYVTLKNLVKFKKSGYYRIYVEDTDGNESYVQVNVDTSSSSSSSNGDLEVSASPTNPDTYEWVKLTIETDRKYTGKINFNKFQYKSSSSSSWSTISNITSSTYVYDYSSDWSNGYYRMTSSDNGYVTLKNLVKFKKSWYYRIYVEDTDWNESYVQVNVDTSSSSSSSNGEIELSTNRKSPSTSQYVNLTIETNKKYTGKLNLSAKYRSSSSASWTSISNTSSTYFKDYSDEWDDGYYKMKSSDKGEITLNNLVKFKKDWYYRVYVKDTDGNESYIQFSVWNASSDDDDKSDVDGFTSTQLTKVKDVYKEWNSMVAQMQRKYPALKKDNFWLKMSESFYNSMKDVIDNKKSRNFDDYDDFEKAFGDWYNYTISNI